MTYAAVENYDVTLDFINQCRALAGKYQPRKLGDTEIKIREFTSGRLDCYLSKQFVKDKFPVPVMKIGSDLYMSVTPMELQSHINPIKWAEGHVITAGLGLGYFVNAVKDKPELDSLTVYESNQNVIDLYKRQFGEHPKVILKCQDIFDVETTENSYDYLYVDIWPNLEAQQAIDDMEKIVSKNPIKASFWGMEKAYLEDPEDTQFQMDFNGCPIDWAVPDMMALFKQLLEEEDEEY